MSIIGLMNEHIHHGAQKANDTRLSAALKIVSQAKQHGTVARCDVFVDGEVVKATSGFQLGHASRVAYPAIKIERVR